MGKQEFKQLKDDSAISELTKKGNDTMEKIKFQGQKKQFDLKVQELAAKAAEFYEKYGEEDWRTSLLLNFLDMSLQMQDIIEVITAFNVANEIIFNALGLMDTSLQMSNGMMMEMASNSHSMSTFKQKLLMRRALRNNRKRVKNMVAQMETSIQMASLTAGMYEGLSTSIAGIMDKMNGKRAKQRAKKGQKNGTAPAASARSLDMIRGILNDKGSSAPPPSASSYPSSSSSASASSGDSGLDGLL